MDKKETLLELVESKTVELVNSEEMSGLRKSTKEAADELEGYKRRLSHMDDLVFECNCESALPSCTYIHTVDPSRDPKTPNFCPLDGKGCRWNKVDKA